MGYREERFLLVLHISVGIEENQRLKLLLFNWFFLNAIFWLVWLCPFLYFCFLNTGWKLIFCCETEHIYDTDPQSILLWHSAWKDGCKRRWTQGITEWLKRRRWPGCVGQEEIGRIEATGSNMPPSGQLLLMQRIIAMRECKLADAIAFDIFFFNVESHKTTFMKLSDLKILNGSNKMHLEIRCSHWDAVCHFWRRPCVQ